MQFISTEDMKKFNELGFTFSTKYTPNNIGSTYHVIITDKEGNEVVHTSSSYGNGSGHGYAMSFAQEEAVARLHAYINNEEKEETVEYDTNFLNTLADWGYILDYGYDTNDNLLVMFDSWRQAEGESHYDDTRDKNGTWIGRKIIDRPSVYEKLRRLADKNLLKSSINKTIKEVDFVFDDEYGKCDDCGRIIHRDWEGLRYVEEVDMELCDDCVNSNDEAIEAMINEAKEDFKKALPVMISEDKIEELGYEKLDTEDFSTRAEQWGEYSYGSHNVHHEVLEKLCKEYDGFPKLTWVGQFDCEYNTYFPTDIIEEARLALKEMTGIEAGV